jgi:hypothetical protein
MTIQTVLNCSIILIGAIIMLLSIVKAKGLLNSIPFVPENQRELIHRLLLLHRGLMVFFLVGYLVVLVAFALSVSFISEILVSIIFFLGALFVLIGIVVQSRLLLGMHTTLHGILPICAQCKKIRVRDGDIEDRNAWKSVESYIAENADVNFSHGLCPDCFAEAMKRI